MEINFCSYLIQFQNKKLLKLKQKNDLRKAVESEGLSLVYQPKIDLKNDNIVALEALLRWQHPEFGQISPGYFIPIAEKRDLENLIKLKRD